MGRRRGKEEWKLGFLFMIEKSLAASNGETRHEPPRGRSLVPLEACRRDEPNGAVSSIDGGGSGELEGGEAAAKTKHIRDT